MSSSSKEPSTGYLRSCSPSYLDFLSYEERIAINDLSP